MDLLKNVVLRITVGPDLIWSRDSFSSDFGLFSQEASSGGPGKKALFQYHNISLVSHTGRRESWFQSRKPKPGSVRSGKNWSARPQAVPQRGAKPTEDERVERIQPSQREPWRTKKLQQFVEWLLCPYRLIHAEPWRGCTSSWTLSPHMCIYMYELGVLGRNPPSPHFGFFWTILCCFDDSQRVGIYGLSSPLSPLTDKAPERLLRLWESPTSVQLSPPQCWRSLGGSFQILPDLLPGSLSSGCFQTRFN